MMIHNLNIRKVTKVHHFLYIYLEPDLKYK